MNAEILDERQEGTSICYLVKILLVDYVDNLPDDYKDYEIQREIVPNTYLDNLISTLINKNHIPPIVLISDNPIRQEQTLTISAFKILDGLQRTYRLNAIWNTMNLFLGANNENDNILGLSKFQLSKKYSQELLSIDSNIKILQSIIDYYREKHNEPNFNLLDCFENNYQWFEVWSNLSLEQEVSKMLVLNAGHKPVKVKHQIELIFLNLFNDIQKLDILDLQVIREKQKSSIQFSKDRIPGSFQFASIIAALLSFREGSPVITNSAFIQKLQNTDFNSDKDIKYFEFYFLQRFISSMVNIDKIIATEFGADGIKWFGREVSLVGVYGALGFEVNNGIISFDESLELLTNLIRSNPSNLNLTQFESVRNSLDLSKVNFGNVNKIAVYNAFKQIIENRNLNTRINWQQLFNP